MNILSIGNSFSQDATRYIKKIAEADGEKFKVVNLFLGQMSDPGDLIGLPQKNEKLGQTEFLFLIGFQLIINLSFYFLMN